MPINVKDHDIETDRSVQFKKVMAIGKKDYLVEISKTQKKYYIIV